MICWVVERALAATSVSRLIVATDDQRILDVVRCHGYEAVMTSAEHRSGTDRIAEVAEHLHDADVIVNVQGDEPMISPETIDRTVKALTDTREELNGACPAIATSWEFIETAAEVLNPNVVKIVLDKSERAIYFSRSPIPYPTHSVQQHGAISAALENDPSLLHLFRKHTGLYAYWRHVLLEFSSWPPSDLERQESLEQLRALEHGVVIRGVQASSGSVGVDTLSDLERVRKLMESRI
jgi:3-deoxy-manno-octulosonate cytidylyltransferase (CMP-KDO synthetase)